MNPDSKKPQKLNDLFALKPTGNGRSHRCAPNAQPSARPGAAVRAAELRCGCRVGRPVRPIFVGQLAIRVTIVVPNPGHCERQLIFVRPFGT